MRQAPGKLRLLTWLALTIVLTMTACGNHAGTTASSQSTEETEATQAASSPEAAETEEPETPPSEPMAVGTKSPEEQADASQANVMVIYFSRTGEQYGVGVIDEGNTAIVADMIIEATGADSFEILPQEDYYPYTYDELTDIAKQEQNENARPAYAGEVPDLSRYDTIFIGAPVWWGDWPMICYTFFENNADALAGKTLIPFSTHAGSGLSGFDRKLAAALPGSTVGEGLAIAGTDTQNDPGSVREKVNDWLSELGF